LLKLTRAVKSLFPVEIRTTAHQLKISLGRCRQLIESQLSGTEQFFARRFTAQELTLNFYMAWLLLPCK
jgi:hypothetical protein